MPQSSSQPSDNPPVTPSGPHLPGDIKALADFWSHFRQFPLDFESYCFDHWYFFTLGYYVILALLAVILDIRIGFNDHIGVNYLIQFFNESNTKSTLLDWPIIFELIGISLIALAFNNWRRSIPRIFQYLLTKERICSKHQGSDINQEYYKFLEQYQQTLLNKKRYILIGSIIAICMIPVIVSIWFTVPYYISNMRFDPLFWSVVLLYFLISTPLAIIIEAYFFGIGCWVIFVTGTCIKSLTVRFDLNITPGHPDNSGGLNILGNFCLGMALPVLILGMLLGIIGIGGLIINHFYFLQIVANIFLFLFVLPLASFTFFVPLWNIHLKMIEWREEYQDNFAERNALLEQRIQSSLDKQDVADAKAAKEEMEILQILHPDKITYPVWPFDRTILFKFLTPQIIPLLSLLSGLIGPFLDALRRLF